MLLAKFNVPIGDNLRRSRRSIAGRLENFEDEKMGRNHDKDVARLVALSVEKDGKAQSLAREFLGKYVSKEDV